MTERRYERLWEDAGELLARIERGRAQRTDYSRYADDPVGFIRDVTRGEPWARQVEVAEAVREHPQVTVRSCHAAGKDWLAAHLSLWWVYARNGLVILTGPSATQVEEILMRNLVARAQRRGRLPGECHVRALRPMEDGPAGILARTAAAVHGLTGFHQARVLFVVTEAQDPAIEHAWDAAFAVATGAEDRILTLGNPVEPAGRFWRAHQPGSAWHAVKIAAEDVPNVRAGRTVVPGLLTREGVARYRREYGEASSVYAARVLAEFPAEVEDALVTLAELDAASDPERGSRAVEALVRLPPPNTDIGYRDARGYFVPERPSEVWASCDFAGRGKDHTVVLVVARVEHRDRTLHVVLQAHRWQEADETANGERVVRLLRQLVHEGRLQLARVIGDETHGTFSVVKRLVPSQVRVGRLVDEISYTVWRTSAPTVEAYNSSWQAPAPSQYADYRAQSIITLGQMFRRGEVVIAPGVDPTLVAMLREEVLAHRVRQQPDGRLRAVSKQEIAPALGRSPDLFDTLHMSVAPLLARERPEKAPHKRRVVRVW